MYRLTPVEYLQLWGGLFAGITLLEPDALLLRLKVRGQGIILRVRCYALMSQSPPKPKTQTQTLNASLKYNIFFDRITFNRVFTSIQSPL